jgi:hypothetical protein
MAFGDYRARGQRDAGSHWTGIGTWNIRRMMAAIDIRRGYAMARRDVRR